jgi:hypothetical protein
MTSDDIRRLRWALKKGPKMSRKERARYLQDLIADLEDDSKDVERTQPLGTPGHNQREE